LEARVEELQSDCDAFMEMAADERDETVRDGFEWCSWNANLLTGGKWKVGRGGLGGGGWAGVDERRERGAGE
jgi:hypothetical protein